MKYRLCPIFYIGTVFIKEKFMLLLAYAYYQRWLEVLM